MADRRLKLDAETREQVTLTLCEYVNNAVEDAAEQSEDLARWADQFEGIAEPSPSRWQNACELEASLSVEARLQLLAMLTEATQQDDKIYCEAYSPQDTEDARLQEKFVNAKLNEFDFNIFLRYLASNVIRDGTGILYCGWTEQTEKQTVLNTFQDIDEAGNPVIVQEPQKIDAVVDAGLDFRVVDRADFTLLPATAVSIGRAYGTAERLTLSEQELLEGIEKYGYDEDAVEKLLAMGPTHTSDYRERVNTQVGLQDTADDALGFYECHLVFSPLPFADRERETAKRFRGQMFQSVLCPAYNIALKIAPCPYAGKPYFPFAMIDEPNRFDGIGLMRLLETLQAEATANLRWTVDSLTFTLAPVTLVEESDFEKFSSFSVYPGAKIPYSQGNEPKALVWPQSAQGGMSLAQYYDNKMHSIVSAEGYGELQPKVRKEAEINAMSAAVSAKFGLYLQTFNEGIAPLAAWIISLYAQYAQPEQPTAFLDSTGREMKITQKQLCKRFRYIATQTTQSATPQMRLAQAQTIVQEMRQSPLYLQALQNNDLRLEWNLMALLLRSQGQRSPEVWIGPEPPEPQPMLPPGMGGMNGAENSPGMAGVPALPGMGGTVPPGFGGAVP